MPTFTEWAAGLGMISPAVQEAASQSTQNEETPLAIQRTEEYLVNGDVGKAVAEMEAYYKLVPGLAARPYARSLLSRGAVRERAGDQDRALEDYRRAAQVAPQGGLREEAQAMADEIQARINADSPLQGAVTSQGEMPHLDILPEIAAAQQVQDSSTSPTAIPPSNILRPDADAPLDIQADKFYAEEGESTGDQSAKVEQPNYPRYDPDYGLASSAPQAASPPPSPAGNASPVRYVLGGVFLLVVFAIIIGWLNSQHQEQRRIDEQRIRSATATVAYQATATAQVREIDTYIRSLEQAALTVFGPESGSLEHAEDSFVSTHRANDVYAKDFIVEVTFYNPYAISTGSWDYGVLLRSTGGNDQFRLVIESNQQWSFFNRDDDDTDWISAGELSNLNIDAGGSNWVKVICVGDIGYFYINNVYITTLDLSLRDLSGDVLIATGLMNGNEIDGEETKYSDFKVRSLDDR